MKQKKGKLTSLDFAGFAAIIVIIISLFFIGMRITGHAVDTDTAVVNVTITSVTKINFTTDFIDFGAGSVTLGKNYAILLSNGTAATDGSWTWGAKNFVLENIGNTNVTVDLKTGKNATSFLGGTPSNAAYQYAIKDNEASSCTTGVTQGSWNNVNTTDPGTRICGKFTYMDTADSVNITVKLQIPSDSVNGAAAITDTFTATATG
jgi:hypothetical protein